MWFRQSSLITFTLGITMGTTATVTPSLAELSVVVEGLESPIGISVDRENRLWIGEIGALAEPGVDPPVTFNGRVSMLDLNGDAEAPQVFLEEVGNALNAFGEPAAGCTTCSPTEATP